MTKTINKNSTSKDILKIFKESTQSAITCWQLQLVSATIYIVKNKNTKKAYDTLKNIIKDYVTKILGEEWRHVSSQRTKTISCAKRIAIAYASDILELDSDELWQFLKNKKLTNQRAIEKLIDKDGKLRTMGTETETETETETSELVQQLGVLYNRFKNKEAFYKAVVALNPCLFGVEIAKLQALAA